ncbi:chaplin [Streptomyces sp. RKAG293]|uniref:chaplin n=1 Tax=Streptomyces sp. RKAG293 TaxID=2893403 RepID=UPI00203388E2|nr:chaplin [Streptomyces sp. RKAG293]MCM2417135.1 chaplin [Streptomyces sp. RKAG293]
MSRFTKATTVIAVMGSALFAGAGMASADAGAHGAAVGSPGVLSGNLLQVPVHVPVNLCGNTVNVIGLLNPAFGNRCENSSDHHMTGDDGRGGEHHSRPQGMHHESGQQGGKGHGGKDDCDH